jgi:alkylation response protein AidB-like acyl-CoA dehydrogenase
VHRAENAFAVQGLGSFPILEHGPEELADFWRPRVAAGEVVAAFALTEPGAGSDVAALSLFAEPDGDGFRLSGEKVYISNAPDADVYTVFARTSGERGARGITAFLVPGHAEGLSGERIALVAPHPIGRLVFDGVLVPRDHMLGEVDRGFAVAMGTLDRFRPSVGAAAVGMAHAALWRPSNTRVATKRSAGRCASSRPSRIGSPTSPRESRRAGCSSTTRPRPTTRASGP